MNPVSTLSCPVHAGAAGAARHPGAAGPAGATHRRRLLFCGAVAAAALFATALFPASRAEAAIPTMSRPEIIARAESALGSYYSWGRESWTANSTSIGPDCSGLVLKCWEVPRSLLYQEEDGENTSIVPRYTSNEFYNCLGPWSALTDRSTMEEGDAFAYNDGSAGHVMLYAGGDAYSYPIVYEAPAPGATVRRVSKYVSGQYAALRRYSLGGNSILLDNPTAKSTGGDDLGGAWTRSTSTAGFYGADYQTRAATTAIAWARWTPRVPSSGYYNIYLRWTSGWNRASNAKVTINTPSGQLVKYIDQRSGGGAWVKMGRYYLNAGYSTGNGSISVHATGANGYVVADAALFTPTQ
jgi:hypothetical protein